MGSEDIQACSYMDDNRRFADVFNGTFFHGERVIDPDELLEANKELLIPWKENPQKTIRDNVKRWYKGMLLAIFVLENQHGVDYHMTIRNMLAEAMEYNRQWKELKKEHRKSKDLVGDEYISGMNKDEKFVPVISLVVYYGSEEKEWDGFCNLHEMLDWKPEMELWKPYINDYKIHVLDYHQMDDFSIFKSEIRQVFRFLKCCEKPEKLKNLFTEYSEEYYNMDEETYDFITELSNSKELIKNKESAKQKEGVYNMCKGLTGLINEGKAEGKIEGKAEGRAEAVRIIRGMFQHGLDVDAISNISQSEEAYVQYIVSEITEHPDWSDLQIAEKLVLQEA